MSQQALQAAFRLATTLPSRIHHRTAKAPSNPKPSKRSFSTALKTMKRGEVVVLPVKTYGVAWQRAARLLGKGNFSLIESASGGFQVQRK